MTLPTAGPGDGIRCGLGYDIHRLEPDPRPEAGIVLAGVRIPGPFRLVAHSDGDAVLHALADALLGATGAGDLGEHFPDSDPAWRGCDSRRLLALVLALPALAGWHLVNCDLNIIAQIPRLAGHKPAMRTSLAQVLSLPVDQVGLKARTNEACDAVGRGQAIQVQAIVLLARNG